MLGDSALGDDEPLGDGGVRAAIGHQGEYLALAGAERGEEAAAGIAGPTVASVLGALLP